MRKVKVSILSTVYSSKFLSLPKSIYSSSTLDLFGIYICWCDLSAADAGQYVPSETSALSTFSFNDTFSCDFKLSCGFGEFLCNLALLWRA